MAKSKTIYIKILFDKIWLEIGGRQILTLKWTDSNITDAKQELLKVARAIVGDKKLIVKGD